MSSCESCGRVNGGTGAGVPIEPINAETTDASVVVVPVANLAVVGASAVFQLRLGGNQTNGQRGIYTAIEGEASRNGTGPGFVTPIIVGPVGYTDAVLPAWTTLGVPAGWAIVVALVGNILQLQFNAAAGQNVTWRGWMIRRLFQGALAA